MMITRARRAVFVATALWLLAAPTFGENADRQQKMVLEADLCVDDGLRQVQVCSGNVVISQGTLLLRGARLEQRVDAQGFMAVRISSEGALLPFFRQKREGVDEYIEAQAQTIEYDGRTDTVKLLQNAQMRRLRGAQLAEEAQGALITYNNLTDQTTIDGKVQGGTGRMRAVRVPLPAASGAGAKVALPLRPASALTGPRP